MVIDMDISPHDQEAPAPPTTVAAVTDNRTANVPIPKDRRQPIEDDGTQPRWFLPDTLVITYAQEYDDDNPDGAWEVTAVASGALLSGGTPARRRTSRTFRGTPEQVGPAFPEWVNYYVDRYHPSKRA